MKGIKKKIVVLRGRQAFAISEQQQQKQWQKSQFRLEGQEFCHIFATVDLLINKYNELNCATCCIISNKNEKKKSFKPELYSKWEELLFDLISHTRVVHEKFHNYLVTT